MALTPACCGVAVNSQALLQNLQNMVMCEGRSVHSWVEFQAVPLCEAAQQ